MEGSGASVLSMVSDSGQDLPNQMMRKMAFQNKAHETLFNIGKMSEVIPQATGEWTKNSSNLTRFRLLHLAPTLHTSWRRPSRWLVEAVDFQTSLSAKETRTGKMVQTEDPATHFKCNILQTFFFRIWQDQAKDPARKTTCPTRPDGLRWRQWRPRRAEPTWNSWGSSWSQKGHSWGESW